MQLRRKRFDFRSITLFQLEITGEMPSHRRTVRPLEKTIGPGSPVSPRSIPLPPDPLLLPQTSPSCRPLQQPASAASMRPPRRPLLSYAGPDTLGLYWLNAPSRRPPPIPTAVGEQGPDTPIPLAPAILRLGSSDPGHPSNSRRMKDGVVTLLATSCCLFLCVSNALLRQLPCSPLVSY